MGGGTGLPVVLNGLRQLARSGAAGAERIELERVTAVVSVSDDGGSSGRLMAEFDTLPPGDVRNCLLALTDDDEASLLKTFLGYRFSPHEGGGLEGHSVGNILLTALARLNQNDFGRAIADVSKILNLRGRIALPTLDRHVLAAELMDGTVIRGESKIRIRWNPSPIRRVYLEEASATRPLRAAADALLALNQADAIILGPGSLFTSVLPSFVIPEVRDALVARSQVVPVFYVCNLTTEAGETDRFSVTDHVRAVLDHAPGLRLRACIANNGQIGEPFLRAYAAERLLRGYGAVRLALDAVLRQQEPHPALDDLALHAEAQAHRLKNLASELRNVMDQQVQVKVPADSRELGGAELVLVDAVAVVDIVEDKRKKRVVRHEAGAVLGEVLCRV
jgi:uncharacterized cofD-like protein